MEVEKGSYKVSLKEIKFLGGIGSILIVLSLIPVGGFLFELIGLILILIALKKLTDVSKEERIFSNFLIGSILRVIGSVIGLVVIGISVIQWIKGAKGGINFLIPWVLLSIGGYFSLQSFRKIAQFCKEKLFATAGILIFIGTILRVILIGYVVEFFGNLLTIVSFFSLKDELIIKEEPKKI
jgi:uncharacterized membrane protein